jgi:putative ABC transport system permease protein
MNTIRLLKHSLKAVSRYKLRTTFMTLGSLVGVAALTLVISVGEGAERKVLKTIDQLFGASSIVIVGGGGALMGGPHADGARLTLDDVEAVVKELPQISDWDPQQNIGSASVRRGDAAATVRVLGQSERSEHVWNRGVLRGEYFDAAAVTGSSRVALIGETVARALFPGEDPLNAEIQVESVPFKVIGVLEPFGTDVHGMDRDNEVVVPLSTLTRRLMNVDTIAAAKLLVDDPRRVQQTAEEVNRILRERHGIAAGRPDDFHTITALQVQQMLKLAQRVLFIYLPLVAGIALLIGAIVAAALMLVSVNERVGEIGLRRAVGARAQDIRLQFLVETAVTTLGGGIGGIALGYLVAHFAARHLHLGQIFSWEAVLLGIVVSVITGLLAGVVPARRAAQLEPADALR